MSATLINPQEWTAVGAWAIHTPSVLTASKVAAHLNRKCRRTRQAGIFDGIEWMCLARFEEAVRRGQSKSAGASS